MINITGIVEYKNGRCDIYVETRNGKRYIVNWNGKPSNEEVIAAWKEDRRWFRHIN